MKMFEKKKVSTGEEEYLHEQQHPQKHRRLNKSEVRKQSLYIGIPKGQYPFGGSMRAEPS